jgi:hypothetical protein
MQGTLDIIPAYSWYAARSGALTFVNERCADSPGLLADHPLRFGIRTDDVWDSHVPLLPSDYRDRDAQSLVKVSKQPAVPGK